MAARPRSVVLTKYWLVKVGLQGRAIPSENRKDAVLTFVIDVSGSMDVENRLGLVKRALRMLVEQLQPTDHVALVVYGTTAHAILGPTPASRADDILAAIDRLQPEGSTNAEAGLRLALLVTHEIQAHRLPRIDIPLECHIFIRSSWGLRSRGGLQRLLSQQ